MGFVIVNSLVTQHVHFSSNRMRLNEHPQSSARPCYVRCAVYYRLRYSCCSTRLTRSTNTETGSVPPRLAPHALLCSSTTRASIRRSNGAISLRSQQQVSGIRPRLELRACVPRLLTSIYRGSVVTKTYEYIKRDRRGVYTVVEFRIAGRWRACAPRSRSARSRRRRVARRRARRAQARSPRTRCGSRRRSP